MRSNKGKRRTNDKQVTCNRMCALCSPLLCRSPSHSSLARSSSLDREANDSDKIPVTALQRIFSFFETHLHTDTDIEAQKQDRLKFYAQEIFISRSSSMQLKLKIARRTRTQKCEDIDTASNSMTT